MTSAPNDACRDLGAEREREEQYGAGLDE